MFWRYIIGTCWSCSRPSGKETSLATELFVLYQLASEEVHNQILDEPFFNAFVESLYLRTYKNFASFYVF